MIQLRPQISLKIDKISKDGICIRIFGWFLFYVILQIMMINNRKKYLSYDIRLSKFEGDANQSENKKLNYTNTTGKYTFPIQNISEVELNLNVTINKNDYYDLEHVMVKEEEILNDMKYQLIVHSEDQTLVLNETHTTSLKCKSKSQQIQCTGYLESIINNGYKDLQFQLLIFHHNALAIHSQNLTLLYENNQYFTMILIFQVLFLFLILYGIYYFFSNLSDYPRQIWPKIHQWLLILLIGMILYNFPILLIRNHYGQFVHYYSNLVELFIQSGLFYFWLSIFELEQTQSSEEDGQTTSNQFTIWNLLKLLLVMLYTVPQAIMDTFIFIMQEELMQYDPRVEIPFYSIYLKFVILSLVGYSVCFVFLLYKSFNRHEKSILITEPPVIENDKQHDPFYEGQQIKEQDGQGEIRNYKLLHILSTICFSALVYYQLVTILEPIVLTSSSTINEWALINIYLCMIVQLYMPYNQPFEDEQQKSMYGDVEMDDLNIKSTRVKHKNLANKKFYTKQKDEQTGQEDDIQI
ncbi:unnamed protein product (macronuclear) [Paramecium tetraurelia]|uniref:Wntless-like transmembrane domain-containing protein n=1 Tax=Paramecium tetraurelia TaxID=5888 RepID=A0DNU2_PARTE|nr:uncharacterized protein GSPATT00018905001 [Paramecium tetraurelia]CAK84709.1 unnamed protein product [Paramecium tetraurelia]|eukprot:XP_001452106.1 hypothetical protein (macronuclear) [Paramecium tetraurelia strain d4-2]